MRSQHFVFYGTLALFCLILGFVIASARVWWSDSASTAQSPNITPYLNTAQNESEYAVEQSVKAILDFFDEAEKHSRDFANVAMGYGSKWRLAVDYIPFTRGNRHEEYLKHEFESKLFSEAQLTKVVESAIANYGLRVQYAENKMLTDIKIDVPDLPKNSQFIKLESKQLSSAFKTAITNVISKAQTTTGVAIIDDISFLSASTAAGEIATSILIPVAVELGVSSGILGAGAASSPYTWGVGIVAALIIDYVITKIWNWYADPTGDLEKVINKALDTAKTKIIDGVRHELLKLSKERADIRKQAVLEMLNPTN